MESRSFLIWMCKILNLESHIQLHSTISCFYRRKQKCLRPSTVIKMRTNFLLQLWEGCRQEEYFLDRFLPDEASATEKKGACILCGNALLPKALRLQLVPDHMTLDHIGERDREFVRVSSSLEVTHSSVSTPVRQWKKVVFRFLSDRRAKIFNSDDVQTSWT